MHGGSLVFGPTFSPLGAYAGYLLLHSGNVWLAAVFLALTGAFFLIVIATLIRYVINYRRAMLRASTI